ncbi:MAG: hypothetical protein ACFFCS_14895 [Candidatus Hodarchaeota archaeon]
MNIIEEAKNDFHARTLNETNWSKINEAFVEIANNTEEGRRIMEEMTEDGDRIVINFDLTPDVKFFMAAEDGKLVIEHDVQREDADATIYTTARRWFELAILNRYDWSEAIEMKMGTWEGKPNLVFEFSPLFGHIGRTLEMPPGMRDSKILDLEPIDMVAFHLEGKASIEDAVAGLIEGIKDHVKKIERIFLIHDKPVLVGGQGPIIKAENYGIIAMTPIPRNVDKKKLFKGDLYELSFDGGKYGAVDSLYADLRPNFLAWRGFAWMRFSMKHDVKSDTDRNAMAEIIVDDENRPAIISKPRETLAEKIDDIKAIVYMPIKE